MLTVEAEARSWSADTGVFWPVLFLVLAIAGAGAFVYGVLGDRAARAWQVYLVNYVFWTGLCFGAVLFSAVLNMSYARWGRPVKRLAEAFGAFLPAAFLLFWVLFFGREILFPWVRQPVPEKQVWLNVPFFFARNGAALLILTVLSLALVYYSVQGDRRWLARTRAPAHPERVEEQPWALSWRRQKIISPILGIAYAFILSLAAFDLIMALDPEWYSTLFGGYYFMACFFTGIVGVYLLTLILLKSPGLCRHVHARQLHDLGKLTLAFSIFTGYLFYAQFNTIWYGNLPDESRYVILRVKTTPWEPLAWAVLFMILIIPFIVLLNRKVKIKRAPMIALTVVILAGMWLERFILVAPSLCHQNSIPIGPLEILITAGLFGLTALCVTLFLRRVPVLPVSDPIFREEISSGGDEERLKP